MGDAARDAAPSTPPPAAVDLTSGSPPATTSRRVVDALPAPARDNGASLHVKVENLHASSAPGDLSSAPATSDAASGTSVGRPLTLADLERVLELRDNRMEFTMAERETKMCKLLAYLFAKPPVDPSPELYRRLQGASSIDELLPALEGQVVDGPHPAVVAGQKTAEAFAERARADLLQHNLCNAAKEIASLRETAATSDALARSLKEEAVRLIDSCNEGQLSQRLLDVERQTFLAEKERLEATIRDKDRVIAAQVDDYRRDSGKRQLLLGRCYELSAQVTQLSHAIVMGDGSAHQWLKRQLADKDQTIRTLTRCKKFTSLVSEFQKQSPFLTVAAMLGQPMPGLDADQLAAFRDASDLLRQAGLGVFGEVEQHVRTPSPGPASSVSPPSRPRRSTARDAAAAPAPRRPRSPSRGRSRSPSQAGQVTDRRYQARSSSVGRYLTRATRSLSFSARSSSPPTASSRNLPSPASAPETNDRSRSPSPVIVGSKRRRSRDPDDESAQSTETPASSSSPTPSKKPKKKRMARWARIQEARQAELATQGSPPAQKKQRSSKKKKRSPSPDAGDSLTEEKAPVPSCAVQSTASVGPVASTPSRYPQRAAKLNATAIQREVHAQESDNDSEVLGEATIVLTVDDDSEDAPSAPIDSSASRTEDCATEEVELVETPQDQLVVDDSAEGSTSRAPAKSPAPSSASEAPTEELNSSVPSTPVANQASPVTRDEAASALASLSSKAPPALTTNSVMIRVLPPGKHPAWSPGDPEEDDDGEESDSDHEAGSAGGSPATTSPNLSGQRSQSVDKSGADSGPGTGSQRQDSPDPSLELKSPLPDRESANAASSTTADHEDDASSLAEPTPKASKKSTGKAPARPAKSSKKVPAKASRTSAKKSSAKVAKPVKPATRSSSATQGQVGESKPEILKIKLEGGPPPHLVDVKTLVQRASNATSRDSRESKYMKRLRSLPFFHKASRRCWEKILASCVPIAVTEKTADGVRIQPTPISLAGLRAFAKVDDPNHPWRAIFRLLPGSMVFVDDTVLDVFPPVEKGKRSRKAETLLEALSLALCRSRGVVRWDLLLALWERMHWIVESSVYIWLAEAWLASEQTAELDEEFTKLWLKLKEYIHERKQRSDLLRLAMKEYGDVFVEAVTHEIDGSPAPLLDTEVCFDPAVPFCPLVNLPWFPKTKNWVAEVDHIDNNEPWRNWWLTAPGRHPYNTIFRPAHPDFPLFVPAGADPDIVQLVVETEREVIEPEPPVLHPKTRAPANRPALAEFLPPNIVHAA